jgi:hypothetical protein
VPKPIREITMAEIEARFELASYWFGDKWCPAVDRGESGCFGIRVVKSSFRSGNSSRFSYDYFKLDADGMVMEAPRGYAKEFKPGRVVDAGDAADRMAAAPADAPRFVW